MAGVLETGQQPGHDGKPALIRNTLDNAVLSEASTWPVEDILVLSRNGTEGREGEIFANAVKRRVVTRLDALDVGVEVQQVSLPRRAPPLVTQIADGENGGVMMNEFPSKYFEVMRECSGSATPAMNVTEYLEHLLALGVGDLEGDLPAAGAHFGEPALSSGFVHAAFSFVE